MMSPKSKKLEPEDMPDRNELAGSWLATLVALTAVGIGTGRAQAPLPAAVYRVEEDGISVDKSLSQSPVPVC